MIMSHGSISAPLIFVTSPNCFTSGKCVFVTSQQNGSISADHIGFIAPVCTAAKHHPPMPSKSEPNVNCFIYSPVPLFHRIVSVGVIFIRHPSAIFTLNTPTKILFVICSCNPSTSWTLFYIVLNHFNHF